jgi:hypothetical protein
MTFDEVLDRVIEMLQRRGGSRIGHSSDSLPSMTRISKI